MVAPMVIAAGKVGSRMAADGLERGGEVVGSFYEKHPVAAGALVAVLTTGQAFAGLGIIDGIRNFAGNLAGVETTASAQGGDVRVLSVEMSEDIELETAVTEVTGSTAEMKRTAVVLNVPVHELGKASTTVDFRAVSDVNYPAGDLRGELSADGKVLTLFLDYSKITIDSHTLDGSVLPDFKATGVFASQGMTGVLGEQFNAWLQSIFGDDVDITEWRPFGMDVVGADSDDQLRFVTNGAAVVSGLGAVDECVEEIVVPNSTEIIRRAVIKKYAGVASVWGAQVQVEFINGPDDLTDPASLPPIASTTQIDERLLGILGELDFETSPGNGSCTDGADLTRLVGSTQGGQQ